MTTPGTRRWPPITAAVAAALLIFLVLPNPLSIPNQNPSASAEYAPVPGEQQEAASANFAETSTATSAGIGAGGEGIGPVPGRRRPPQPVFKPRQKACVGNPPRQTEDPLSPPCVPFFEGENGGETFQGVTKDEIVVIFYNDRCCDGDLTTPWKPSDEGSCTYPWECDHIVRTMKAHLRFFQDRYQTYGRTVRLIAMRSSGNIAGSCASREGDAKNAIREFEPFAVVSLSQGNQHCFAQEMAENSVPVLGLNEDVPESIYTDFRPYAYGFMPTQEVHSAWSASFLCNKLNGQPARFSSDPTLSGAERSFGLLKPASESVRDAERVAMAELLQENAEQCGLTWDDVRTFANEADVADAILAFKQGGITTVVCQCADPDFALVMTRSATNIGYLPEYYFDSATYMDRGQWLRTRISPEQGRSIMGTTYFWWAPAFRQQYHYRAYLDQEPNTQPNVFFSYRIYHLLLNLFQGIQAAGPNLTPETIETGMFTFNWLDMERFDVPAGGYGPYNSNAVSNYTFVDTGMAWWWDPSGTPPGGKSGEGCVRTVGGGRRSYPGDWPSGDTDLFVPTDPCSEDLYKIADANGTDLN